MHNLCVFCTFCTFAQKIYKGWGCNFTWSFGKVMRIISLKMVFVARVIRHKLCIFLFSCSKIIFDQKLFSYCWDQFDYQGSIVYLFCFCCLGLPSTLFLTCPALINHFICSCPNALSFFITQIFPPTMGLPLGGGSE